MLPTSRSIRLGGLVVAAALGLALPAASTATPAASAAGRPGSEAHPTVFTGPHPGARANMGGHLCEELGPQHDR